MNETLLREYADLKIEITRLTGLMEEMKPKVVEELVGAGVDELKLPERGVFVVVPKRKWKYPPAIGKMEEALKEAKTSAEAKGEATYSDATYVRFDQLQGNFD